MHGYRRISGRISGEKLRNLDDGGRAVGGGLLYLRLVFIEIHAGFDFRHIRHLKDLGGCRFAHPAAYAAVNYFNFGDSQLKLTCLRN
jgi:hypothetical protein